MRDHIDVEIEAALLNATGLPWANFVSSEEANWTSGGGITRAGRQLCLEQGDERGHNHGPYYNYIYELWGAPTWDGQEHWRKRPAFDDPMWLLNSVYTVTVMTNSSTREPRISFIDPVDLYSFVTLMKPPATEKDREHRASVYKAICDAGHAPSCERLIDESRREGEAADERLSTGGKHTCVVTQAGTVKCWGSNIWGQSTAPLEVFRSVSAGAYHSCGVTPSGSVKCWGLTDYGSGGRYVTTGRTTPPPDIFKSVSAGVQFNCGVTQAGTVKCWGNNRWDQSNPPSGPHRTVSAGYQHACGLLRSGAVTCWGFNDSGQSTPPSGTFTSVSAGGFHTCGILLDGSVKCWGSNSSGQSTPPSGTFTSVSVGETSSCGILLDGSVKCWGSNSSGQSTPPSDTFTSVSSGATNGPLSPAHTCAVLRDHTVKCWGDNKHGQSTPPPGLRIATD